MFDVLDARACGMNKQEAGAGAGRNASGNWASDTASFVANEAIQSICNNVANPLFLLSGLRLPADSFLLLPPPLPLHTAYAFKFCHAAVHLNVKVLSLRLFRSLSRSNDPQLMNSQSSI